MNKFLSLSLLLPFSFAYAMDHNMDHSMHMNMSNMNHNMMNNMHHNHNTEFPYNKNFKFEREMLLPPLLTGKLQGNVRIFDLQVQQGEWEFIKGKKAKTFGYNGPILGPILALNRGEDTKINIKNHLNEETTVHFHGAIVSEESDGVHNSDINPNDSKTVTFNLDQEEATLWFHPHPMHKTASQVYKGLAGLIYLKDDKNKDLALPNKYGFNDFPIVIQDKQLAKDGSVHYMVSHHETMHGKTGGILMVNGIVNPFLNMPHGLNRLRVVNGSNASNFNLNFNGQKFYQIASDGGYLNNPVEMTELLLSPGERAEIVIDTTNLKTQDYLYVNGTKALEIRKTKDKSLSKLPTKLADIKPITEDLSKLKTLDFNLKTTHRASTINDAVFDMTSVEFSVKKGEKAIWNITNSSGMMDMPHPFHVHGAQFRVLERNGKTPPLNEQGYKDTILLDKGENVKILVEYKTEGLTVYHCHLLEHEETGMMGQFKSSK